jgi:hypothetical protein
MAEANPVKRANWANANSFNSNAFNANFAKRKQANKNEDKLNNISLFLNDVAFFVGRCIDNTKTTNKRTRAVEEFRLSILSLASIINKDIMQLKPTNSNNAAEKVNNTLKKYFVKVLNGKIGVKTNRNNKVSYTPIRKVTINRVVSLMAKQPLTPQSNSSNKNNANKINQTNINKLKNKDYTRLEVIVAMIKRLLSNKNLKPIKTAIAQEAIVKNFKKGTESFQKRLTSESEIYNEINKKIQSALLSIAKYEDAITQTTNATQQNNRGNNSGVVPVAPSPSVIPAPKNIKQQGGRNNDEVNKIVNEMVTNAAEGKKPNNRQ